MCKCVRAHTIQDPIRLGQALHFYPVAKKTKTKSTKLTKLVTTCLTSNVANMDIVP